MSKGGSKRCFITLPGLAAGTNRLPPSTRARRTAFCKEGFSQRLWGLTCSVPGLSAFLPSIQPATEMLSPTLGLTALPRLSTVQARAGVLELPPGSRHLLPCLSSARWFNTPGQMCWAPGAACPQGAGLLGRGHPGTVLTTEPAQQWGSHAGVAAAPAAAEARARLHAPLPLATCRPGSRSQPPQAF